MLVYNIGQEGSRIVEHECYDSSIFASQYRKALRLIDSYLVSPLEDTPQIVCFCGDRGEGKTSCMQTVSEIITSVNSPNIKRKDEAKLFLDNSGCKKIEATQFHKLDIIDPSFFDTDHNLLEVVIGNLYGTLKKEAKAQGVSLDRIAYRNLSSCFEKVKRSVFNLHKNSEASYSELTELDSLASAIDLKIQLKDLFDGFLKFVSKDKLLITIDDIDMNMSEAYEMCEQIRKYLSCSKCIVMMAVNFEQLEQVIAIGISNSVKGRIFHSSLPKFEDMAQKYLIKLLPIAIRIHMPSVYGICGQRLRVKNISGNSSQTIEEYKTIKDAIVQIIFRKTRFLFYNSKGGVSLIVPNNLRQLMSMLGMLYAMEEITDQNTQQDILLSNKSTFKNYFYYTWSKQLPEKYRVKIIEWVDDTQNTVLNKSIVTWLKVTFDHELLRKYNAGGSNTVKLISDSISEITYGDNFSYNVSVGDVFYIINLLSLDHMDVNKEKMIFFIKSLYSIMLYEAYDVVTFELYDDSKHQVNADVIGLYQVDHRFDFTNDLQTLINGAYFTYLPGELLPTDTSRFFHFDKRIINGSDKKDKDNSLNSLLSYCNKIIATYDDKQAELNALKENKTISEEEKKLKEADLTEELISDESKYRLAEFFILFISRSVSSSDLNNFYLGKEDFRQGSRAAAFAEFNLNTGYYAFDIMAPFYNLTNPEFCYKRFNQIVDSMYSFSLSHSFSLLSELIDNSIEHRMHIAHDSDAGRLHCLMSDSILRNGEVISAIFANAVGQRFEDHDHTGIDKIIKFYGNIFNSEKRTHSRSYNANDSHMIVYNFLKPLSNFISELANNKLGEKVVNIIGKNREEKINQQIKKIFNDIFDYVEHKRKNENDEQQKRKQEKSSSKPVKTVLTDKQKTALISKLLEYFGPDYIGDNKSVYNRLLNQYTNEIKGLAVSDVIKRTEAGKIVNYNVEKIIEVLQTSRQRNQLELWMKLFEIN
ncbi:MAG: hypothetical protein HDS65_09000 [Bacteroidales bacterium]|nr:hypothetical protein [Bacteroidales bacterium]